MEVMSSVGGANSAMSSERSGVVRIELLAVCLGSKCSLHHQVQLPCCQPECIGTGWHDSHLENLRLNAVSKEAYASSDGRSKPVSSVATLRLSNSIPV